MCKIEKCKFSHPTILSVCSDVCYRCLKHSGEGNYVSKEDCEQCPDFQSRYIEFPVTVEKITNEEISYKGLFHNVGSLCAVRPCGEEYKGKTFVGIYLGDLPIQIRTTLSAEGVLTNSTIDNPAIYVPEIKKIVFGCESWWSEINSFNEFKEITQDDIDSQWYVQLAKTMFTEEGSHSE